MNDFKEKMKERTRKASVCVLKACDNLPESIGFSTVKNNWYDLLLQSALITEPPAELNPGQTS